MSEPGDVHREYMAEVATELVELKRSLKAAHQQAVDIERKASVVDKQRKIRKRQYANLEHRLDRLESLVRPLMELLSSHIPTHDEHGNRMYGPPHLKADEITVTVPMEMYAKIELLLFTLDDERKKERREREWAMIELGPDIPPYGPRAKKPD